MTLATVGVRCFNTRQQDCSLKKKGCIRTCPFKSEFFIVVFLMQLVFAVVVILALAVVILAQCIVNF